MVTARELVISYLKAGEMRTVEGPNGKFVQNQRFDDTGDDYGLYDENGDWHGNVLDVEAALNYIGL